MSTLMPENDRKLSRPMTAMDARTVARDDIRSLKLLLRLRSSSSCCCNSSSSPAMSYSWPRNNISDRSAPARLPDRRRYVGVSGAISSTSTNMMTGMMPHSTARPSYDTNGPMAYTYNMPSVTFTWMYDPSSPDGQHHKGNPKN